MVLPSSGRELHAVDLDLAGRNLGEIERQATADVASPAAGRKPLSLFNENVLLTVK